jgi:hypothetical protein
MSAVSRQPNDCYTTFTNLVTDTKIFQNFGECRCKIETRMGTCHLNKIKQHRDRDAVFFEMDTNSHIRLVVGQCPSIRCKAKGSFVFLVNSGKFSVDINQKKQNLYKPVGSSQCASEPSGTHFSHHAKQFAEKVSDTQGVPFS